MQPTARRLARAPCVWRRVGAALALAVAACGAAGAASEPIERLETDARARPDAVADELERLLRTSPIEGLARLDAEQLLGVLRARLRQPAAAEAVAQGLVKAGEPAYANLGREPLQAASACIRAQLALSDGGSLARADTQLAEHETTLRDVPSARLRMRCLGIAANIKQAIGRTDDAVRLWQEAIRLADESGIAWRRSAYRSSLAYALYRGGQGEHAGRLNDEARKIADEAQDWFALWGAVTTESILLTDTGQADRELAALESAIEFARRAGAAREEALGLANLSDFYLQAGEFPRAYEIAQRALPLARAQRDVATENLALLNSGLALISMKRKDEGMALIRPTLEHDRAANDLTTLADGTRDVARYMERAGYLGEAYAAYRSLRDLSVELARHEQQEAVLELQEAFDAQQRRRELALLKEDNALKEEQFRRRELEYRVWALTALIVLALLALAARMYKRLRDTQYRLRHRTEQLRLSSQQDPLTGLANRRRFHELTEHTGPQPTAQGALYLLDLDHFKRINDEHGHAAGDAVLVEVARRLQATLREEDLVVRWGGEEFLVLVRTITPDRVEPMAQRLLNAVAALPVSYGERRIPVTTSIGFAEFPLPLHRLAVPWSLAVDIVDNAMYVAKTQGRNRACGVGAVPSASAPELATVVRELERAWREGRVQLHLLTGVQPAEAGS